MASRWERHGVWKGMRPLDTLSAFFTVIADDRRESGASGGRLEQAPERVRDRILEFGRTHT